MGGAERPAGPAGPTNGRIWRARQGGDGIRGRDVDPPAADEPACGGARGDQGPRHYQRRETISKHVFLPNEPTDFGGEKWGYRFAIEWVMREKIVKKWWVRFLKRTHRSAFARPLRRDSSDS